MQIIRSHVAGRDHIEGIPVESLHQIIKTLLKHFPKHYLQDPKELDKTLNELRKCHEELGEYKELHNKINDILIAFDPFKKATDNLIPKEIELELEGLRTLWQRVAILVEELLDWSQTIKHIGKPLQNLKKRGKRGVSWAVHFSELQEEIDRLGLRIYYAKNIDQPNKKQMRSVQLSEDKNLWVGHLKNFAGRFNDLTLTHMNITDQHLLKTAQKLLTISHEALSNH